MSREMKLGFVEFLGDIRGVLTAPRSRFSIIHDRDAVWGSLVLLMVPAYFGGAFAGGIYFKHDPFPGYSFLLPAILAAGLTLLKLLSIHVVARIFERRRFQDGVNGSFRKLVVVFGYTGVPALGAILVALGVFLLLPAEIGRLFHSFRIAMISIVVALGIALFVWNVILMVLALRVVYRLGDFKILISAIAGPLIVGAIPGLAAHTVFTEGKTQVSCMRPILADRVTRFATADLTAGGEEAKISVHVDRLAYRRHAPGRFDLVAVEPDADPSHSENRMLRVGRIVGIPGDSVELVDGRLRINGQFWAEPYIAPEFRSSDSFPEVRLGGAEYLVLPEDRRLVPRQATDRIVPQRRIEGRVLVRRWPFGWCWFRPSAFLSPFPIPE